MYAEDQRKIRTDLLEVVYFNEREDKKKLIKSYLTLLINVEIHKMLFKTHLSRQKITPLQSLHFSGK